MGSVTDISVARASVALLLMLASLTAAAATKKQAATNSAHSAEPATIQTPPSVDVNEVDSSTVVYPAAFFEPHNPVSANDMLDRIPGVSIDGGGGGRGLGTGGDLLINGQQFPTVARAEISRR